MIIGDYCCSILDKINVRNAELEDETTTAPTEEETTAAPTKDETTTAPTEDETTAAPSKDETTAAPTEDETTASPTKDETTAAPTEDETINESNPSLAIVVGIPIVIGVIALGAGAAFAIWISKRNKREPVEDAGSELTSV